MRDISVIIATYNEKVAYLKKCIESVLNQTHSNFEIVITVEPADGNLLLLKEIQNTDSRVRILENRTRQGVAASRNKAIKESSGKYIAIMDSDDYCNSTRLEKQYAFLENNSDINVLGSNLILIDGDNNVVGERKYPEFHRDIKDNFLLNMAIANPSVMLKRKEFEDVGFFDDHFKKAEDVELWLRFLAKGKRMHNLQESLVFYRMPLNSNLKRGRTHYKNFYIARKRHNKFIWPFYKSYLSLGMFFIFSHIPEMILDVLLNLNIVNRLKNIKES